MKKMRIPHATRARNPRTTMTAIAQWGNEELLADCTFPVLSDGLTPVPDGEPVAVAETEDSEAAIADERDAASREDCAAADVDAMDATMESANVVSG